MDILLCTVATFLYPFYGYKNGRDKRRVHLALFKAHSYPRSPYREWEEVYLLFDSNFTLFCKPEMTKGYGKLSYNYFSEKIM